MNALIVDECDELRIALSLLLSSKGYRVSVSRNCKEALNILREPNIFFDLLLTEYNFPQMNGSEFIEKVINLKSNVQKIVVLSSMANNEQHLKQLMAQHSQIKFLHKMTTTEKLLNFIAS